jgi:hypothetical protein
MALCPELTDEEDALDEIQNNILERLLVIDLLKATNTPQDANGDNSGLTPEQNGALGPAIRDGKVPPGTTTVGSFAVGDRVRVIGIPQIPGQSTGTVTIANGEQYGILFDGEMQVHKWYLGAALAAE